MSSLVLAITSIILFILALIILWILSGYPPDDGSGPRLASPGKPGPRLASPGKPGPQLASPGKPGPQLASPGKPGPQQEDQQNTTEIEDINASEVEIEEAKEPDDVCIPEPKPTYRSKGEAICCTIMEEIYGVPFKTQRPSWLINPESGRRMELDCYNELLEIAVEYNGIQHYVWPNHFIREKEDFLKQVRRDLNKAKLCSNKGVHLIVVPYTIPHTKIKEYIQQRLKRSLN